jgi:transcriptional regulator with XRE-family HTH domain
MLGDAQRTELARFLRTKRAALSPAAVGARSANRRRTPGLRREEVADRAGVSITWYTWLEQGRDIHCSISLVARLAKALRLSRTDTDYLFRLAGHSPPPDPTSIRIVEPAIHSVFEGFTAGPALLMSPRLDILAFNPLADAVFRFGSYSGPFAENHLWRGFMHEERRKLYVDWEDLMFRGVALLRAHYATRIGDQSFETLIQALLQESPDFSRMWEERRTVPLDSITLRLESPDLGKLTFTSTRFSVPTLADHVAFFLSPADEASKQALARPR